MSTRLNREQRFLGSVMIGNDRYTAAITLQPDIELHIYMPMSDPSNKEIPKLVEGQLEGWDLRAEGTAGKVSFQNTDFNSIKDKIELKLNEGSIFQHGYENKFWQAITFRPSTCTFTKIGSSTDIPDEWGITFYPEKNNNILFHLFSNSRSQRELPKVFSNLDGSLYFNNNEQWTIDSIQERLKLLISCLSFFTGAPVSYELLVGRYKKEVLYIQLKNESSPNSYICPSHYNGHADIVDIKEKSEFKSQLIKKVEAIFKNPEKEKIVILLSYYIILYTALYDEVKIAFSFQLMESLAKYKDINFGETYKNEIIKKLNKNFSKKMCYSCINLLQGEIKTTIDDFGKYIESALDVIRANKTFIVDPDEIREIARTYRNEIFHGSFFDNMTEIDRLTNKLPDTYKDDLPLLFQAIASLIGANFILGIDFNDMVAIKRENA